MSIQSLPDSTRGAGHILSAYGNALRTQKLQADRSEPFLKTRISHLGSRLAHLDQALNKLDDPELAAAARRGLRALGEQLGERAPQTLHELGKRVAGFKTEQTALLLLQSADALDRLDLDLKPFAKAFTRITSLSLGGRFTVEARQIAELSGYPDLRESTFRRFLERADKALDKGEARLQELLDDLESTDTLEQKAGTLAAFGSEPGSPDS